MHQKITVFGIGIVSEVQPYAMGFQLLFSSNESKQTKPSRVLFEQKSTSSQNKKEICSLYFTQRIGTY